MDIRQGLEDQFGADATGEVASIFGVPGLATDDSVLKTNSMSSSLRPRELHRRHFREMRRVYEKLARGDGTSASHSRRYNRDLSRIAACETCHNRIIAVIVVACSSLNQ